MLTGCGTAASPPRAPAPPPATAGITAAPARAATPTGPVREITFDDIKLEMEKGSPFTRDLLPKRVTALEQERVRIRGYILPSF